MGIWGVIGKKHTFESAEAGYIMIMYNCADVYRGPRGASWSSHSSFSPRRYRRHTVFVALLDCYSILPNYLGLLIQES